jgi:two-component system, cell cycle response regulator DivK
MEHDERPVIRKSVLVVEDNRDELLIYSTVLGHRGYTILAASDFDSALRVAAEQKPDLAVVDVNLGDVARDGCDLVSAFRNADPTRNMPIVAHTAFGDVYRRALESAGCEAVIHKPTNPHHLVGVIEGLIGPPTRASSS